jgi:hypothetical protein
MGMLIGPLVYVITHPDQYVNVRLTLRVLSAVGAGVICACVAALRRQGDASSCSAATLVVLFLVFAFDLPAAVNDSVNHGDLVTAVQETP